MLLVGWKVRRLLASGGGAVKGKRCLTRPLGAAVFRMAPYASATPAPASLTTDAIPSA